MHMREIVSETVHVNQQWLPPTALPTDLKSLMAQALDVTCMLPIFQRELSAMTDTPIRVTVCKARADKTRVALPQKKLRVTYHLVVECEEGQQRHYDLWGTLPVTPAFLSPELLACCRAAQGHPAVVPFARLAAYIPELHMGVQFLPVDLALPALLEATQPHGGRLVAPFLPECQHGTTLVQSHAELLHYRPGTRCVVKFTMQLSGTTGDLQQRVVFAKLFADGRGAAIYRDLQRLWNVSRRSDCLRVPEPLGYDPERRMLVMAEALGERDLNVWVKCLEKEQPLPPGATPGRLARSMAVVAEALHELHDSGMHPAKSLTFHDGLSDAWQDLELIRPGYPELARDIERILARLQTCTPPNERLVPCHGGFRHKQLVGNDEYVTLIDWDGLTLAHPALDAASFLCRLRHAPLTQPGKAQALEWLAEVFRREFLARQPDISPQALALYETLVLMDLTLRALRHPERREHVAVHTHYLVAEAERLLDRQENLVCMVNGSRLIASGLTAAPRAHNLCPLEENSQS
jgi:hypothetical protein